VLWAPFRDYVLATINNTAYAASKPTPSTQFLDFRQRISEITNFDPSRNEHWSTAGLRSQFRLVGGTWTAVTGTTPACQLCQPGYLKPWQGPGQCEMCSERVLPQRSAWVSPTWPGKACAWECDAGLRHLEPRRYYFDISALWWEHGLSLGMGHTSNNVPNRCVPCTSVPSENPCGKGQYWSTVCTSTQDSGCDTCSPPPPNSKLYTATGPLGIPPPFDKSPGYDSFVLLGLL